MLTKTKRQWTITDASLSPDNKYLAYSSIRSTVCLALTDPGESGEPYSLDFSDMGGRSNRRTYGGYSHFGVRDHSATLAPAWLTC